MCDGQVSIRHYLRATRSVSSVNAVSRSLCVLELAVFVRNPDGYKNQREQKYACDHITAVVNGKNLESFQFC